MCVSEQEEVINRTSGEGWSDGWVWCKETATQEETRARNAHARISPIYLSNAVPGLVNVSCNYAFIQTRMRVCKRSYRHSGRDKPYGVVTCYYMKSLMAQGDLLKSDYIRHHLLYV